MPSKSKAQRNLMAAAAHNPAFAKKVGVPVSVAQEFNKADKGKKFGSGGMAKKLFGGKESYSEELKEAKALKSGKISEKGFVAGEKSEGHKDEEKNPAKLAREIKSGKKTPAQYAKEEAKEMKMAKGGRIASKGEHAVQKQSKRGAEIMTMKKGGSCGMKKYARGGGIEVRGKTKGRII